MPNEEKMTIDERRNYLRLVNERYLKGSKRERGRLLDEMEAVTGLHRKGLIRLMSGSLERRPRSLHCGPVLSHALAGRAGVARRSLAVSRLHAPARVARIAERRLPAGGAVGRQLIKSVP